MDEEDDDGEEEEQQQVAALGRRALELSEVVTVLRERVGAGFASTRVAREAVTQSSRLVELDSLRREVAQAEEELCAEEDAETRDMEVLRSTGDLRDSMEDCHRLLEGIAQNDKERMVAEEDSVRLQFLLEARQMKLLSELQTIYPIERVSGTDKDKYRYAIRGIEFLPPFEGSPRDDEQISTVLGYIVHLTLLISKYLEIPLRFQLLFFASRSIIRDSVQKDPKEQNLPLYRKDVEPERFRRALQWLTRDVEQLLTARGIPFHRDKDLLHNLNQHFRSEMDPGGVLSGE